MATKTTDAERRSKVAEACIDFGSHLLRVRISSATPNDAREAARDLFNWFENHDAFTEGNVGIALHAITFGSNLLESRKTATLGDSIDAIQVLFEDLAV